MGMLDDAVLRARLRAGTDLIMFRKVLLTLDGVLADVSADVHDIDELLPIPSSSAGWPPSAPAPAPGWKRPWSC